MLAAIGPSLVGRAAPDLSQTASPASKAGIPMVGEMDSRLAALVATAVAAVLAVFVCLAMMSRIGELGDLE